MRKTCRTAMNAALSHEEKAAEGSSPYAHLQCPIVGVGRESAAVTDDAPLHGGGIWPFLRRAIILSKQPPKKGYGIPLLVSGIALLAMLVVSAYAWVRIPAGAAVCTHWNAMGQCDGWGSRAQALLLMPAVVAAISVLFAAIPRIAPRANHIAQSRQAYTVVWLAMLAFFLVFHVTLTLDNLGHAIDIAVIVPVLTGALFIAVGSVMDRVRSNYLFGIRTPWTLASERSWRKTHRLGRVLFIALGLLVAAGAVLGTGALWVYLMLGGIVAMLVTLTITSYVVWRRDPARTMETDA